MGKELGEQAIQVEWSVAKVTAKALKELIEQLLANRNRITHGEQSLSRLNLQGKKLESVELDGQDLKSFRRELNKYSVDYSVMKNRETGNYIVFFKGQDVDRVYVGLQKCVQDFEKNRKKPVREVMQEADQRAAQRNADRKPPEHEHKADRGKDLR